MSQSARYVLALVLGSQLVATAIADGPFRCGSKIIYTGLTEAEVLEYCGEPTSKTIDLQEVRSPNNRILGTTEIHRWTYKSYSATRALVFVDDKLQSIERF